MNAARRTSQRGQRGTFAYGRMETDPRHEEIGTPIDGSGSHVYRTCANRWTRLAPERDPE
jgi:hypothetical protein